MNLSGLLDLLAGHPSYRSLLSAIQSQQDVSVHQTLNLQVSARPQVAACIACDIQSAMVIVTARQDRAYTFAEQMVAWHPQLRILTFAEPGPVFYEFAAWGTETIQSRLQALAALKNRSQRDMVVVVSARALIQRTLPPSLMEEYSILLRRGSTVDNTDRLLRRFMLAGYEPVTIVTQPGSFSHRGGIVDIYPIAEPYPVRLELWGNAIETIRHFDPDSQRSLHTTPEVVVTPAREAIPACGPAVAQRLSHWFAQAAPDEQVRSERQTQQQALASGIAFSTIESFLPWMYEEHSSLLDYLPSDSVVLIDNWEELSETVDTLEMQALELRRVGEHNRTIPPDMPLPLITWDQLRDDFSNRSIIEMAGSSEDRRPTIGDHYIPAPRFGGQLNMFLDALSDEFRQRRNRLIVVSRQAERLNDLWHERGFPPSMFDTIESVTGPPTGTPQFVSGSLSEGWTFAGQDGLLHLFTDAEIFGWKRPEPRRRSQRRAVSPEAFFADVSLGDYVVHTEYGIGQFEGLEKRTLNGNEREFLVLRYEGSNTLYVPIHQADRLTRYIGPDDSPPELSRLGTPDWVRVKNRTREAVEEIARELLDLYAARETVVGHSFSPDTPWQHELEASFPYAETADQLKALADVKADMESSRPMDRLICGDVGYGKTEVALRAAFKAVMDGKQVAILVPTTVLAQQHYETFSQRLTAFPVVVEMLSRFRTKAEQEKIISALAEGTIDIVIGTHRLIGRDIWLKDLGLLIIDEEQRFGVTHKERLKQMRTEVDVLTLTATPIPRTLYMSLAGVRDISMINTAPEERLPVITYVSRRDDNLIRQAILRELDRGGQVFYVHNRVQTIEAESQRLRHIVPEASFAIAHGQMHELELERVMTRFAASEVDVLISTNIIEAGLDIPNANTLIVDRADRFGLAQLYQLRGRVGRSASRAYAYFFHPPYSRLTPEARVRLETIAKEIELGAGLNIAMRDLELRGAGDILGARQHGHIATVGFHLYTGMLAQAVRRLRESRETGRREAKPAEAEGPPVVVTIDVPLPTYIPTDYIDDDTLRIQLYRRMADLYSEDSIRALEMEMTDRFGPLPPAVEGLFFQLRVKEKALRANVEAVVTEGNQINIRLAGLALIDRRALQDRIGQNVRVSRTGIWLPTDQDDWTDALLEVLARLAQEYSILSTG